MKLANLAILVCGLAAWMAALNAGGLFMRWRAFGGPRWIVIVRIAASAVPLLAAAYLTFGFSN
jgi:hypothetical protein